MSHARYRRSREKSGLSGTVAWFPQGNQRYVDRESFMRCFVLFLRNSICKCINRIQQEMSDALWVGNARAVF